MSRFWSDHLARLTPYVPGEQPADSGLLKLNTNEHPYGPSPLALEAIRAATDERLRLYPDPESTALSQAIAAQNGVSIRQVLVGNGSDEILAHVFNGLFLREKRPLLMPDISYGFYPTYCRLFDVPFEWVPLAQDFRIRVADYLAPRPIAPAGIILANPNAPTGLALGLDDIAAIAAGNPDTAVVIDEAYVDFGAQSAVSLLAAHPNLVVLQTLSKSRALAGLRVGFAIASPDIIAGLVRVKNSFNSYPLDRLAQAGALASINDTAYFEQTRRAVIDARTRLSADLAALGFEVLPSQANFVFARHKVRPGKYLAAALREQKILVRHFDAPRIADYLRITVGTPDECARLIAALSAIINSAS